MAFIVEDGTGCTAANSYDTLSACTAYHSDRGNTAWAAISTDALKQEAMVRGSQAVDQMGFGRFPGTRDSLVQGLQWPREDAYDREDNELTGVPQPVKDATFEAALAEAASPGCLSPALSRGGQVKRESVAGAVDIEYFAGAVAGTVYTKMSRALAPVLGGAGLGVVRC